MPLAAPPTWPGSGHAGESNETSRARLKEKIRSRTVALDGGSETLCMPINAAIVATVAHANTARFTVASLGSHRAVACPAPPHRTDSTLVPEKKGKENSR
jgi:hypothetical protein